MTEEGFLASFEKFLNFAKQILKNFEHTARKWKEFESSQSDNEIENLEPVRHGSVAFVPCGWGNKDHLFEH